ncbi:MAG: sulfurtransferase, partial [Nitrospinota bacterium]
MSTKEENETEWPNGKVFVDLDYVLSKKGNAIVVDTRAEEIYLKGHIPGAISLGKHKLRAGLLLRDALVRMRRVGELEKILGSKGMSSESEIILYGDKSDFFTTVVYWILDVLGYSEIRFFNDGIAGAIASGVELETTVNSLAPVKLRASIDNSFVATTTQVYENLTSKKAVLMDVRTPGEHSGGDPRALRGGRIPGSIHIHVEDNLTDSKSRNLKPVNELKKLYENLDPNREVIIYCQLATRA